MAMSITAANAVNVLLAWITGDARHSGTGNVPPREAAIHAASTLAELANKALAAGWLPDEVLDAWPPEVVPTAAVAYPRLTVRFSVGHLLDPDWPDAGRQLPSGIGEILDDVRLRIENVGIDYRNPRSILSEGRREIGWFELARREPS